jgi:hypothetical protein
MARTGLVLDYMRQTTVAHPSHRHPFLLFREKLDLGASHRALAYDVVFRDRGLFNLSAVEPN